MNDVTHSAPSVKRTLVGTAIIAAVAALVLWVIFSTEPKSVRGGAVRKSAMSVDVVTVESGRFRPRVEATGTVEAAADTALSSQVSGTVLSVSDAFAPGGRVKAGDILVRVDRAEFANALAQRKSDLQTARMELELERARQEVAQAEHGRMGKPGSAGTATKDLALRRPQLAAAAQRVEAAQAAVTKAQLDLKRTVVRAPFDAVVVSRDIQVGMYVTPGASVGRLVGIDEYWVTVHVPLAKVPWIDVPQVPTDGSGSPALLRNPSVWPEGVFRSGVVRSLVGALDGQSRMARVVVAVPDPLGELGASDEPKRALLVGEYVQVAITGKELPETTRIRLEHLREDNTVWVAKDGVLKVQRVHVLVKDSTFAYIDEGLAGGATVVTSNVSTVRDGAPLRIRSSDGAKDGTKYGVQGGAN